MKITDLLNEKKDSIELFACLQCSKLHGKYYYFGEYNYSIKNLNPKEVKRLCKVNGVDLIELIYENRNEIWLGHWNNGVA